MRTMPLFGEFVCDGHHRLSDYFGSEDHGGRPAGAHRQAQAMTSLFGDPTHLRKRAEEMRKIADGMRDDRSKHLMRQIADDYERLAKRVEERAKLK
jgi:DNA-binding ferritin-like protein